MSDVYYISDKLCLLQLSEKNFEGWGPIDSTVAKLRLLMKFNHQNKFSLMTTAPTPTGVEYSCLQEI